MGLDNRCQLFRCPILLRQTCFLALKEHVHLSTNDDIDLASASIKANLIEANHQAQFGEIQERGAAITERGRELYYRLLQESMALTAVSDAESTKRILEDVFKQYPDTWTELRRQGLIYCEYFCIETTNQVFADHHRLNY